MSGTPEAFDPYFQWLGIEPAARPVHHYSLLGLALFEADPAKITAAADERMGLIRQFQAGPRGMHTHRLLNELSAAKLCLLSAANKAAYDGQLHRQLFPPPMATIAEPESALPAAPFVRAAAPLPKRGAAVPATTKEPTEPRRILSPFNLVFGGGLLLMLVGFGGYSLYQHLYLKPVDIDLRSGPNLVYEVEEPQQPSKPKPKAKPKTNPKPNPAAPVAVVILQEGSGEVNLTASTAQLTGKVKTTDNNNREVLSGWRSANDVAEWRFKLVKPGPFEVELQYVNLTGGSGRNLQLACNDNGKVVPLQSQGSVVQRDFHNIEISTDGEHTFAISPADDWSSDTLRLISVRLIPGRGP